MQWAAPSSGKERALLERLSESRANIVCAPESYLTSIPDGWHGIFSGADYGYPIIAGPRKVALWSRRPWRNVDDIGHSDMSPGRFVAGVKATVFGDVFVVGVCIPWRSAHVFNGRRDRVPWQVT
jgi:hypothetical protein